MYDYKHNDPRGWCSDPSRGAALGRATIHEAPRDSAPKLYLRREYLDSGGYDRNGTYFGVAGPLYCYRDSEGTIDAMLRASSREAAKAQIRATYPNARFFR